MASKQEEAARAALSAMKATVAQAEMEHAKFFGSGVDAAGTRLRKHMQDIKANAQAIREAVSEARHTKK